MFTTTRCRKLRASSRKKGAKMTEAAAKKRGNNQNLFCIFLTKDNKSQKPWHVIEIVRLLYQIALKSIFFLSFCSIILFFLFCCIFCLQRFRETEMNFTDERKKRNSKNSNSWELTLQTYVIPPYFFFVKSTMVVWMIGSIKMALLW